MSEVLMSPSTYCLMWARMLSESGQKVPGEDIMYEEKDHGFQCGTCRYVGSRNDDDTGTCVFMEEPIHLINGCCALWEHDPEQLQYDEKTDRKTEEDAS